MKRTAKNFEEWQRDCSRDDRPGENDKTATENHGNNGGDARFALVQERKVR